MDYEHYLVGLLFPQRARKHFFAVRAFNIELAIIKDVVSNSAPSELGKMRLDFWRQVITSCYKVCILFSSFLSFLLSFLPSHLCSLFGIQNPPNPPPHPIARALCAAITECKLSRSFFKNIIDKRVFVFYHLFWLVFGNMIVVPTHTGEGLGGHTAKDHGRDADVRGGDGRQPDVPGPRDPQRQGRQGRPCRHPLGYWTHI